jgi:hypothetical protein
MNMKKTFLLIFFVIAIAVLVWYGYPVIKNRYFGNSNPSSESQNNIEKNNNASSTPATTEENKPSENNTTQENQGPIQPAPASVTSQDCDNECAGFSGDKLEYCRQVCGLATPRETSGNCDNLNGINKDYCLKDLAISKKDFKICDEIQDSGIKKTCKNRVTEDIFDEMKKSNH